MTELEEHLEIDRQQILDAVRLQMPVEVTTYTLPRNMEAYFRGVEEIFLKTCHQEHLIEYMNFSLGELLTNSKKANTKRVYFKEKNLDINDPDDYVVGMENFKDDTFADIDYYLELQKKAGLYIKLSLQYKGDNVIIEIRNNSILTTFENDRIQNKLNSVQQYSSMDEVVTNVLDQSEGAGLGIIIIILMLQKAGLSQNNFKIYSDDKETITQIILPCDKKIQAGVDIISYEFVNLQHKIPVMRETIEKASKYFQGFKIKRRNILELVRKDITASLLIMKNALEKDKNCFNLSQAMDLLSDEELSFIFSDSNPAYQIVESNEVLTTIQNHAVKTAYFAYNLCKNLKNDQFVKDAEYVYLLGLLNSLGRFLMETASEEQKKCIEILSSNYEDISEKIVDVFKFGNADKVVSQIYTKKLGFADEEQKVFGSWNDITAENASPAEKILYIAEMMQYYNEGIVDFYQIDKNILSFFEITEEKQLKSLIGKLSK